jgi:uncharacterized protein (TIGR03083 family)
MRSAGPPVDTRAFFRPLSRDIVALLRTLSPDAWDRPTVAGAWRVRQVVAHLLDTALRRLSADRDGETLRAPECPLTNEREVAAFINELNAFWIRATEQLSSRVLTDLYERASTDLAEFFDERSLDGPARFAVSWAGESESAAWFDIGREFTEIWHHGAQIRDAVGAGPFVEPRWLHAVLDIAVRVLPHAYRHTEAHSGEAIQVDVTGSSGGRWLLEFEAARWTLRAGDAREPITTVTMTDDTAWRLFFNALSPGAAESLVRVSGDIALSRPLLSARSLVL